MRQTIFNGKMSSISGTSGSTTSHPTHPQQQAQGLTALLVMIAVLCILLAYCFWGAPWCRAFCRRRVCCFCPMDDPEGIDVGAHNATDIPTTAPTPTIILLPFGRMLVVDGSVFARLQATATGIDLMELGEDIVRAQAFQTGSSPSIMQVDSETTSKGLSPTLDSLPPPTYDSIFGSRLYINDLPPSYSQISLQMTSYIRQENTNNFINANNQRSRENICPIAEEESYRIATSDEDVRESTV